MLRFQIGKPYHPNVQGDKIPWDRMNELTEELMLRLAELMPEQYWGFYHDRMPRLNDEAVATERQ